MEWNNFLKKLTIALGVYVALFFIVAFSMLGIINGFGDFAGKEPMTFCDLNFKIVSTLPVFLILIGIMSSLAKSN